MRELSVFDAHCDTIFRCQMTGESLASNQGMISLDETSRSFRRYCQFFALFSDVKRSGHPDYDQLLACFRRELQRNSHQIVPCTTREEAECANRKGLAAAFLTVEGGELLGCDPERLDRAAADGVIAVNLTWNHANELSGSCREQTDRGLSEVGRRFVQKMEQLHILPDVSHLSDRGFWDVAELVEGPILASHSNARAICQHHRNLSDDQISAIIRSKGVIGLNFYRDFIGRGEDLDAVTAHLEHILDLGGAGHIGLGGDWDGCDTIRALPAIGSLRDLWEHLLRKNYSETFLQDLFYNNLMRVVRVS